MFLVFVRRSNDIDHIVPIVYALRAREVDVAVLCQDPQYDIQTDFRLAFLRETLRVPVDYVYRFHTPTRVHRQLAGLLCSRHVRSSRRRRGASPGAWVGAFYRRFVFGSLHNHVAQSRWYGSAWAADMLYANGVRGLVFDHNPPSRYLTQALLDAAREAGIPTVAVPHGTHMLVNELRATSREQTGRFGRIEILEPYDHVVAMEPMIANYFMRMGLPAAKVTVLGSARYCQQWRHVLDRIAPPPVQPPVDSQRRLRLVYMDKQARERVHQDVIEREVERIAGRSDVALVIKPETRTNQPSSPRLADAAYVADAISSRDLINWADAVMVGHSSIAIEVLLQGRTLLHARYFHDNMTMFDEMGACWVARSPAELDQAIDRLSAEPTYRPYEQGHVERFLRHVVDGGMPGRDVLGDYSAFLTSLCYDRSNRVTEPS